MADRTTKIKRLLSLTVVISVGLVVWIFIQSRQGQHLLTIPLPDKATQSILALSRIHQTATKDGAIQWELEAGSAELEPGSGKMVLKDPLVDFFLKDGTRVNLKASKGILNTKNNNIEVRGNVEVVFDRYTLNTETLVYNHQTRRLQAREPVRITGQSFNLKAAGMVYDLETSQATFNGDVNGTIYEKPAT